MSLKLRTRATLLIAVTFSALLATFLFLTFYIVKQSFEIRTVEEMRSQLRHVLSALPRSPSTSDLERQYLLHGRTGESPLAITVWHNTNYLGVHGPDSLSGFLPKHRIPETAKDTTFNAGERFIVYALHEGDYWGASVMSEHTTDEIVGEMIELFDVVLIIGILLSIIVAAVLSRLALDPISKLTAATERLLGSSGTNRLPVPSGPQEAETLAERFNQILEQRDRSIETLKHFTADVAHELRSPLTIMRGELEVELRSGNADASQRETLESSLEEVKHLSGIVDDLLYLARLENVSEATEDLTEVNWHHRVNKKFNRLLPLIEKKRIDVSNAVDPSLVTIANPAHIDRMLYNLILNAVQYSLEGGSVAVASHGKTLTITDNGVGIKPEDLEHVTERFYRADPSRNRDHGNVGLGLAIAQGIARKFKIELKIDSALGKGTTVMLILPS